MMKREKRKFSRRLQSARPEHKPSVKDKKSSSKPSRIRLLQRKKRRKMKLRDKRGSLRLLENRSIREPRK